jgi:hypothetical protein
VLDVEFGKCESVSVQYSSKTRKQDRTTVGAGTPSTLKERSCLRTSTIMILFRRWN